LYGVRIRELWSFEGTLDRGPYILIGLIGFAIKHNLDRFLATFVCSRQWGIFSCWVPPWGDGGVTATLRDDPTFFGTMVAAALPFIWVGLAQTLKRLRGLRLAAGLAGGVLRPLLEPGVLPVTELAAIGYQHRLWPAVYWKVFSDYIIHRIHLRVLRHIKGQAESAMDEQPRGS
jgi:hypothetical protein